MHWREGMFSRMWLESTTMGIQGLGLQGEIPNGENDQIAEKVYILVE